MNSNDNALIDFCVSCFHSPLRYVRGAFSWGHGELASYPGPDEWQAEMLTSIENCLKSGHSMGESLRFAVASGHGIGKSAMVAWLILWAMSTRPGLAGVITANTAAQLTDKTWRELAVWHKRAINQHWFRWTATKFYQYQQPEKWFVAATPWSKDRPEAFAGLHGENGHVLLIFDEASAIDDAIWVSAEGALTTPGVIWVAFGNPTRNTGRFKECFNALRHRWHTRQIDGRTAKMTNKKQIQEWIDDYGDDSDFVRVRVKGEFPRSASNQLISEEDVKGATLRTIPDEIYTYAPKIMGVDVARFGDDTSVIAKRQGLKCHPLKKYRSLDLMTFADHIAEEIKTFNPEHVFVDQTGIGAGVVDRLHQLGHKNVVGVDFGSSPSEANASRYFNKRAEIWCLMREWIKNGDIPNDKELITDLVGPEYGFSGDRGQIQLERKEEMKKRGLASPDCGDALALTFTPNNKQRLKITKAMVEAVTSR